MLSKAQHVIVTVATIDKKEKPDLPEAIQEAMDREKLPENLIKVPATMHNPHPVVASSQDALAPDRIFLSSSTE